MSQNCNHKAIEISVPSYKGRSLIMGPSRVEEGLGVYYEILIKAHICTHENQVRIKNW